MSEIYASYSADENLDEQQAMVTPEGFDSEKSETEQLAVSDSGVEKHKAGRKKVQEIGGRAITAGRNERSQPSDTGTGALKIATIDTEVPSEAVPNAKTEARYWSAEYNGTEEQFVDYCQSLSAEEKQQESYRATVARYKGDIAYNWRLAEQAANRAMSRRLIKSSYELAVVQEIGTVNAHETVEAATGIFYDERNMIAKRF